MHANPLYACAQALACTPRTATPFVQACEATHMADAAAPPPAACPRRAPRQPGAPCLLTCSCKLAVCKTKAVLEILKPGCVWDLATGCRCSCWACIGAERHSTAEHSTRGTHTLLRLPCCAQEGPGRPPLPPIVCFRLTGTHTPSSTASSDRNGTCQVIWGSSAAMAFNRPISLVPPSPLDLKQSEHLEQVRGWPRAALWPRPATWGRL